MKDEFFLGSANMSVELVRTNLLILNEFVCALAIREDLITNVASMHWKAILIKKGIEHRSSWGY